MVILFRIGYSECDGNPVDEARIGLRRPLRGEIIACAENKLIAPGAHLIAFQQRRIAPAVAIRRRLAEQGSAGGIDRIQFDGDALGRLAERYIENMRTEFSHDFPSEAVKRLTQAIRRIRRSSYTLSALRWIGSIGLHDAGWKVLCCFVED
jgi:hypothetical protein